MKPILELDVEPVFTCKEQLSLYTSDLNKDQIDECIKNGIKIELRYYKDVIYSEDINFSEIFNVIFKPTIIAFFSDSSVAVCHQMSFSDDVTLN